MPKAELRVGDQRLVDRAVSVLARGGCDTIVAVVQTGVAVPGARTIVNRDPDRGLRSSLELAVADAWAWAEAETTRAGETAHGGETTGAGETATASDDVALAVVLADMPGIGADAVRAVVAHWRRHPDRIATGRFAGRRGHPTVMSLVRWAQAVGLAGSDEGARRYLDAHADLVDEVDVPGDPVDLDRPEDVDAWLARGNERGGGGELARGENPA
jgi:CTP:molybdopterin cytidylyltransferase MocA